MRSRKEEQTTKHDNQEDGELIFNPGFNDIKARILKDFKAGISIKSLTLTYWYDAKNRGGKIQKSNARLEVEKIILEDCLENKNRSA